jgi:hypothetical protein
MPDRPGGGAAVTLRSTDKSKIRGMLAESDDWAQILAEGTCRRIATGNDIFALAMRR